MQNGFNFSSFNEQLQTVKKREEEIEDFSKSTYPLHLFYNRFRLKDIDFENLDMASVIDYQRHADDMVDPIDVNLFEDDNYYDSGEVGYAINREHLLYHIITTDEILFELSNNTSKVRARSKHRFL